MSIIAELISLKEESQKDCVLMLFNAVVYDEPDEDYEDEDYHEREEVTLDVCLTYQLESAEAAAAFWKAAEIKIEEEGGIKFSESSQRDFQDAVGGPTLGDEFVELIGSGPVTEAEAERIGKDKKYDETAYAHEATTTFDVQNALTKLVPADHPLQAKIKARMAKKK